MRSLREEITLALIEDEFGGPAIPNDETIFFRKADAVLERLRAFLASQETLDRVLDQCDYDFADERTDYPRNRLVRISDDAARVELQKLLLAAVSTKP